MKQEFPLVQGIYVDSQTFDFRVARPKNLYLVPKQTGTSMGYFRQAEGTNTSTLRYIAGGKDVASLVWRDCMYRLNTDGFLRKCDDGNTIDEIALPHGVDAMHSALDYSFDNLIICSNKHLYYYNETDGLREVTDQSLGEVHDALFIDGYTMTTDGEYLVVTELNDPMAVNPLKYGSSEADPDPVVAIRRVRGEIYALNKNTIEVFQNVGGDNFPFQRVDGALCMKGCHNRNCAVVLGETLIFIGSARGEGLGLYMYNNGLAHKLSTNDIDAWLEENKGDDLSLEARVFGGFKFVYIRGPGGTILFDFGASEALQQPVFIDLHSPEADKAVLSIGPIRPWHNYRFHTFTLFSGTWYSFDSRSKRLVEMALDHMEYAHDNEVNQTVWWEVSTPMLYAEGLSSIISSLELVCVIGSVKKQEMIYGEILHLGPPPTPIVYTSYSNDGRNWSDDKAITLKYPGYRTKRVTWFNNGLLRHWRMQRIWGNSDYTITMTRLQADLEVLDAGQAR